MKNINRLLVAVSLLMIGVSCTTNDQKKNESISEPVRFVQAKGTQLVEPNGETLVLKGTNLGHWLVPEGYMFKMNEVNAPRKIDELLYELIGPDSLKVFWQGFLDNYITHDDIKYLKRIGANHIRLPFHYKMFSDEPYMGEVNSGFKYFDRVVDGCKQDDIYLLFDLHCAPGGQTGDNIDDSYGYPFLLKSQSSQDQMTSIWVAIAERYKDESIVLGYDIVNEPIATHFNDEIDELNHALYLLYKRIVKEVRAVDKDHLIFLNGSNWSGNFDVFETMFGPNIVYEFHKYWFDVNQDAIQQYLDFRDTHQVPIYIGETGENTDVWVEEFRALLDTHEVGWAFWPYKKMNNTRGIMNFDEPEFYHLITAYAKSDRSSYKKMRENRPDIPKVQTALNEFIINSHYQNNYVNPGYTKALNFEVDQE